MVKGQDCNLNQVKLGMAWHYKQYLAEQVPEDRIIYSEAEIYAKSMRIGLWIDINPTPPWEFRKR